ncbi:FAD-dependent oxidoreductase [uncultured Psychroserpens sp.]|uniref:NAD(P)/FAD-dependent oxidoreductase n=1 Tax=uncultured Psychroserpens sp. TaxID=255436 RepID=UPI002629A92F|nr:FAD-dependent oxidoreductase [uncultured Psychroserpens sp.]
MKTIDYIIVGCGLAGIAFSEQLRAANKTFLVFDNNSQHSSRVAAGLYNPVVLKRFTKVWKAKTQLELALPKYKILEQLLDIKLDFEIPVYRKLASIEEQNEWFVASDKPVLSDFLSTKLVNNTNAAISAKYGFGEVLHSGRINTTRLVEFYRAYLKSNHQLSEDEFHYDSLDIQSDFIQYETIKAKHIIFAEGYGLSKNPFFNFLPLNGTKGEMLTIKAPDLNMDFILKSSVFIVPLEDDLYWVGGTYEWEDKTYEITNNAKEELLKKVKQVISCDFEVVHQVAGIRPTTKDRRPLVGTHSRNNRLHVLNGLGTRGVMMSPYVAEQLFNHIEKGSDLDLEIDIKRFDT